MQPLPQPQMLQCPTCNRAKTDTKFYTETKCQDHGNIFCCYQCIRDYGASVKCPYCQREFSDNEKLMVPFLISSLGADL